jgi:hypothetical protein
MLLAGAGLVAGGLAVVGPASAAAQDVSYSLTSGSLSVGAQSFTLPASGGFNGTLDDATGDLEGEFVFPVIQSQITDPLPAVVKATLVQQGPAAGSIDPVSGDAQLAVTIRIGLEVRTAAGALLVGGNCGIGPVNLDFTGSFDAGTGKLSLSDEGFALPNSTSCQGGLDFGPIIDNLLGGDTAASLVLTSSDAPIATTTTTKAPATTDTTAGPTGTASTTRAGSSSSTTVPGTKPKPNTAKSGEQVIGMVILDQPAGEADVVITEEDLSLYTG